MNSLLGILPGAENPNSNRRENTQYKIEQKIYKYLLKNSYIQKKHNRKESIRIDPPK